MSGSASRIYTIYTKPRRDLEKILFTCEYHIVKIRDSQENLSCESQSSFFLNGEIFIELNKLEDLGKITPAWISIYLQCYTSTRNV